MSDGMMNLVSQVAQSAKVTEERKPPLETISRAIWAKVWLGLIAQKHISKQEEVGGSTCEYWRMSCQEKGLTEQQVANGTKRAKDFEGNLKLGDFMKLCKEFKQHPSHCGYQARLEEPAGKEVARKSLDDLFRACPELCPERHRERLGL